MKKRFDFKNLLLIVLSLSLIATAVVAGTLAYRTAEATPKNNVFTVGNIDIELTEDVGIVRNEDNNGGEVSIETNEQGEMSGATYIEVMPGDYLTKKVSIANTGSRPAYVAVTVTINNAGLINKAIDEFYEGKGYTDEEVQAMYDYIFDGFGFNYMLGSSVNGMRLAIEGDDMPEYTLHVDSVKTLDEYWLQYKNNWYKDADTVIPFDGYYTADMSAYELRYTYYLHMPEDTESVLFNGIRVPAEFTNEQMDMFDGLEIDVKASAIQADNIPGYTAVNYADETIAKTGFSLLREEMKDGVNDGDVGEPYFVSSLEDLDSALASSDHIVLGKSLTLDALTITDDVTIDMNGKTLTVADNALVIDGAEVVFENGKIFADVAEGDALTVKNGAVVDLDGVTVNYTDIDTSAYGSRKNNAVAVENATLNINDGTVLNLVADEQAAILARANAVVNVNGGEVNAQNTSPNNTWNCVWCIFVDDASATVNMKDGVLNAVGTNGATGIYASEVVGATINVTGGTINVETSGGYGIAVEAPKSNLTLTGGTINLKSTGGAGGYAVWASTKAGSVNTTADAVVNVYKYADFTKNDFYETAEEFAAHPVSATVNVINTAMPTNDDEIKEAINGGADLVILPAGEFKLPNLTEGLTIIGTEGTTVTSTLSNTMKDVTIKNVTFEGGNTQRWAYAKGDLVFENCTFDASSVYAIHYDGTSGANIVYKNCTIIGWVAITGGHNSLLFEDCTIIGNGTYGVIRTYGDCTIRRCTFDVDNVKTTDIYQDGVHAVDCTIIMENCTNVNGSVEDLVNVSGTGEVIIN